MFYQLIESHGRCDEFGGVIFWTANGRHRDRDSYWRARRPRHLPLWIGPPRPGPD